MVILLIKRLIKTFNFLRYRFQYLINYIIIGLLSVLLEVFVVKYLFFINVPFSISVISGFVFGVLLAFILNAELNFKVPKEKNKRTFLAFLIIATIAFILNIILVRTIQDRIQIGYEYVRFVSAAIVFMLSYTLHRKITFDFVKKVGIAIYLNKSENISDIYKKIRYYADFIHLDLVDKSLSKDTEPVNLSIIKDINQTWGLEKMIHIMSKKPSFWIKKLNKSVDVFIFHLEIEESIKEIIKLCKTYHKKIGISITIDSQTEDIIKYLPYLDFVQVMGIDELGKSGQIFNPEALKKVEELNKLKKKYSFNIIFDGGVKPTNISRINAKYIVSASGLLNSREPIKAFMELKTSSRYHSVTNQLRKDLLKGIEDTINSIDFVKSGNLVGSFSEGKGLQGINDIDIVLIADNLTKNKFETILDKFTKLKNKIQSAYGVPIIINPTFGPLKFNTKNIVFHLMIYDANSHKLHCLKSPFTCLDWQRSKIYFKKSMSKIYPVRFLQPSNFFSSRRSATEYLSEIKSNKISYREYRFNRKIIEDKKYKEMNNRDKIEFSYHITRFLVTNFLKLYYRKNEIYKFNKMLRKYFKIFPKNKERHKNFIKEIKYLENKKKFAQYPNLISKLEFFIKDFENQFKEHFFKNSKEIFFIRHAKTRENLADKRLGVKFIGRESDVDIIQPNKNQILTLKNNLKNIDLIFSSPLKRCKQTLKLVTDKAPVVENRLNEINYGEIDGLYAKQAQEKYPGLFEAWEFGEDPRFPNGENNQDVFPRINEFLKNLKENVHQHKRILICTHNVILRILIGSYLRIPMKDWHIINIPYFEPIKFILTKDNRFYIELTPEQNKEIFKNF